MIKKAIQIKYPNHNIILRNKSLFIVDRTNESHNLNGVYLNEILSPDSFYLSNSDKLELGTIIYDNTSFTQANGQSISQCECAVFPYISNNYSWILFIELKYCKPHNKEKRANLPKAKDQLLATHSYYKSKGIIPIHGISYLIAGFPKVSNVPFANNVLTPSFIAQLRRNNIIIKIANDCSVINHKYLDI